MSEIPQLNEERLAELRSGGVVAYSSLATCFAVAIAALVCIRLEIDTTQDLISKIRELLQVSDLNQINLDNPIISLALLKSLKFSLTLAGVVGAVVVASILVQTKFLLRGSEIKFDLSRIKPKFSGNRKQASILISRALPVAFLLGVVSYHFTPKIISILNLSSYQSFVSLIPLLSSLFVWLLGSFTALGILAYVITRVIFRFKVSRLEE